MPIDDRVDMIECHKLEEMDGMDGMTASDLLPARIQWRFGQRKRTRSPKQSRGRVRHDKGEDKTDDVVKERPRHSGARASASSARTRSDMVEVEYEEPHADRPERTTEAVSKRATVLSDTVEESVGRCQILGMEDGGHVRQGDPSTAEMRPHASILTAQKRRK